MIKEILDKLLNGEHLTDAEKDIAKNFNPISEDDVAAKVVAKERKRTDKIKTEYEQKLSDMQEQLKVLEESTQEKDKNMSDLEKIQKQMEKLQKQLEEKDTVIQEREKDLHSHKKNSILGAIKNNLDLAKGYDLDYVDFTLGKMASEFEDLEELQENSENIIKQFTESHPQLIRAEGTGTGLKSKPAPVANGIDLDAIKSMKPSEIAKNLDAIVETLKQQ